MSTTTRRRFLAGAGAAAAGLAVAGAPGTALAHPGRGRAVRHPALHRRARDAGHPALGARDEARARARPALPARPRPAVAATRSTTRSTPTSSDRGRAVGRAPADLRGHPHAGRPRDRQPRLLDRARAREADPDGGKVARAARARAEASSYYALRLGAWKLIVLDSISCSAAARTSGRLGDEQTAWLTRELAAHAALDARRDRLAHPDPDRAAVHGRSLRQADDSFLVPARLGRALRPARAQRAVPAPPQRPARAERPQPRPRRHHLQHRPLRQRRRGERQLVGRGRPGLPRHPGGLRDRRPVPRRHRRRSASCPTARSASWRSRPTAGPRD